MLTGSCLERVNGLGEGETIATLKEMVSTENLAVDTLLQVPYNSYFIKALCYLFDRL